jgi:hypothetical protein
MKHLVSLVQTPEVGDIGYLEAVNFVGLFSSSFLLIYGGTYLFRTETACYN